MQLVQNSGQENFMSNIVVRIGIAGFVAIALAACGKSEEKKVEATPQPVAAAPVAAPIATSDGKQKVGGDSAVSSRQLASQKSAIDAARCGIVFLTAVDVASRGGDSKGSALMGKASQATQYVIDVAVSDRGETPQTIKNKQTATTNEAQFWSQQQFETFIAECTKEFSDLAPLMRQEGLLK